MAHRPRILRLHMSLWRAAALACALVATIWVGWRILTTTASQNIAVTSPDAALLWASDQPSVLDQFAARELADPEGDLDAARGWAQRALIISPLDARAISLLGQIADKRGDRDLANTLMQLSASRGWRDSTVQAWLFDHYVRRGDYASALPHADAVLRINIDLQSQLFPVLASLTVNPRAFEALTQFLITSPPWRTWFLTQLSALLANRARLVELYSALKQSSSPPAAEELRTFLNRLIKDGDFQLAHRFWRETLPVSAQADETYPFNRDFEGAIDGLPFNWVFTTVPGADVQIAPSPDGNDKRVLRVQFSGARVAFANARQLMLLPAGSYTLAGRVRADSLEGPRGLWWNILCAEKPHQSLVHTDLVKGTLPWTNFTVTFTVPPEGCRAQFLQLELPARIPSEQQLGGQAWYQYLRIAPARTGPLPQRAY